MAVQDMFFSDWSELGRTVVVGTLAYIAVVLLRRAGWRWSRSTATYMIRERNMPESDKSLPENSKENLDRKLDHAVEETFPTSDPVSVQVTKGGAIDYDDAGNPLSQGSADAPGYVAQATEALGAATSAVSEVAHEAYEQGSEYARSALDQGRRYVRQAAERYPQAERYYEQSRRVVREYTPENPMLTLLLGAAVGYGMAWVIHHRDWRDERPVPDYARTRRGFKPYRT